MKYQRNQNTNKQKEKVCNRKILQPIISDDIDMNEFN